MGLGNTHLIVFPTKGRKEKQLISNNRHFSLPNVFNQSNIYKRKDDQNTGPAGEVTGCSGMVLIEHLGPMQKPMGGTSGGSLTGASLRPPQPHPCKKPEREATGPEKSLHFQQNTGL